MPEDLHRLAELLMEWGQAITAPAQWLVSLVAMIPKKRRVQNCAHTGKCVQGVHGLDDEGERGWDVENSHEDDDDSPPNQACRAYELQRKDS